MLANVQAYLQLRSTCEELETFDEEQLLGGSAEIQTNKEDAASSTRHRQRLALLGLGLGVVVVCTALVAVTVDGDHRRENLQQPTIRQVMESPELNDIMANNLMTLGHVDEPRRDELRLQVAETVKQMSDRIRHDFTELDEKMDSLTLTNEAKESVLHSMQSFSDSRIVTLAQDMSQAVHEALDAGLDRDGFRALVVDRIQPRLAEMQSLRDDFFSGSVGGPAETSSRFEAVIEGVESSRLMQSFDRWSSKSANSSTEAATKTLLLQAAAPQKTAQPRILEAEGGVKAQLWEFFQDIHQTFRDELGDLKQEFIDTYSPSAIKAAIHEQVEDFKQDMRDTVSVMREDLHETLSPSAMKARLQDSISEMKREMTGQMEDAKQDVRNALSPKKQVKNLKQTFHNSFHNMFQYGSEAGDDAAEADASLMQCIAQLVEGNPDTFMECSMQALSLCIDLVRSMFAPTP